MVSCHRYSPHYSYDHQGSIVARTQDSDSIRYLNENQNPTGYTQALSEVSFDTLNTVSKNWFVDQPGAIAKQDHDRPSIDYLLEDHIGSVRGVEATDAEATIVSYSPFGTIAGAIDPSLVYAFGGQRREPATGLQWHRARWYSPQVANWLSPDPEWDFPRGFGSPHGYCGANPVNSSDPTGRFTMPELTVVNALIGIIAGIAIVNIGAFAVGAYIGDSGEENRVFWFELCSKISVTIAGGGLGLIWGIVNDFGQGFISQMFAGMTIDLFGILLGLVGFIGSFVFNVVESIPGNQDFSDVLSAISSTVICLSAAQIHFLKSFPFLLKKLFTLYKGLLKNLLAPAIMGVLERMPNRVLARAVYKLMKKEIQQQSLRQLPVVSASGEFGFYFDTVGNDLKDGMMSLEFSLPIPNAPYFSLGGSLNQGFSTTLLDLNSAKGFSINLSVSTTRPRKAVDLFCSVDHRFF